MEDIDSSVMLKEKLLSAGIDEISAHGVKDFSLRRVAAACGASCAAPYKHFKNKEHFINEIIQYVEDKWTHLSSLISNSYADPRARIAELCVAFVRFKIGNPLFGTGTDNFDPVITKEIEDFCETHELDTHHKMFVVSAMVTGTASLIENYKTKNDSETFDLLRKTILRELEL